VADFGISILLSAPTYTLTQIQLAQVYVDTQGPGSPFGVEQFKLSHKERPRSYRLDLSEKAIASRQALFGVILKIREACLHRSSPLDRCNLYCTSASLRLEGVRPNKSVFTYWIVRVCIIRNFETVPID
jgi:hypothetical protein